MSTNRSKTYYLNKWVQSVTSTRSPQATGKTISAKYPFESKYVEVSGYKVHYVEEGKGDPILFLHGNPTWSYLWRNVIPYASKVGRAIAMDLIGMGKSDKPDIEYRFFDHAKYLEGFISGLGLKNLTLVLHDWGSALGFDYAMRNTAKIKAIAFMEAILWVFSLKNVPEPYRSRFTAYRTPGVGWDLIARQNVFIDTFLPEGVIRKLTDEEMRRYHEPFPTLESRKPVWRWPNEIPFDGEPKDVAEVVTSYVEALKQSDLPKLLLYSNPGLVMRAPRPEWCKQNLKNLSVVDIGPGKHFVQEDNPHLIGEELVKWYSRL